MLGYGANTLIARGPGLSLVAFPRLAVLPDNVQVTAAGRAPDFCGLNFTWTHSGRRHDRPRRQLLHQRRRAGAAPAS